MRVVAVPRCVTASARGSGESKKVLDLRRREIGREVVEGIALDGAGRLAAHGRAGEHAQGVETRFRAIAIGIGDHFGLQHAVVRLGDRLIADGIARGHEQQIVFSVIGDDGRVAEGILETMREKEMRLREGEFLRRRIAGARRVEGLAGGNP